MNDKEKRKWRLQQLLQKNKDKLKKTHKYSELFNECVESLGDATIVLSEESGRMIMHELVSIFPLASWGRIDWSKVERKIKVNSPTEIINILGKELDGNDTYFFILWGYSDSPCLKAKLGRIIQYVDGVMRVGTDQFVFCLENSVVIEFYHDGDITIGFAK
ncbi:hypothetical protein [Paenibacillus radicis (ex Xue et al. 2023)]|uniref:Uncharacterized protein n=1 Tax=Paenibacillus radicis (ex Xue et al. 2023) TaxID=2972489 RepID=A0ABT1YD79_9BACL|nr:hypothetical protein [Paenibacillus radicis (ex Xue et al. 2023)]MCR8630882.1 hypothetical protein [Paenibacillus radicis (ex Xue et al. 2023)]